jgi:thiamine biosynthesis protein ThiS
MTVKNKINMQFNGERIDVENDITMAELLAQKTLSEGHFIVVLNDELVVQTDYDDTVIKTNDAVDILSPITGG